jgi:Protein of unknown function (DUF2505)
VRFRAEHHFAASADDVAGVLLDPDFHRTLDLPDLARPEIVEASVDGDDAVLRLRYEYVGELDPIAKRLLGDRSLTWLQDLELDRRTGKGRLSFSAEAAPDRLYGSASVTIADDRRSAGAGATSTRRFDGELRVSIGPFGGMAERRIVPGLLRRLDIEAEAVDERLRGPGGTEDR